MNICHKNRVPVHNHITEYVNMKQINAYMENNIVPFIKHFFISVREKKTHLWSHRAKQNCTLSH